MAQRKRDYGAEYQRRKKLEVERARAEHRLPSLAKARGKHPKEVGRKPRKKDVLKPFKPFLKGSQLTVKAKVSERLYIQYSPGSKKSIGGDKQIVTHTFDLRDKEVQRLLKDRNLELNSDEYKIREWNKYRVDRKTGELRETNQRPNRHLQNVSDVLMWALVDTGHNEEVHRELEIIGYKIWNEELSMLSRTEGRKRIRESVRFS